MNIDMDSALLTLTPQGQSSERNLPGTIVINDTRALRKSFETQKRLHHKKADKILRLTPPPLPHWPCSKYFDIRSNTECPLKPSA